jgi:hypothetical protein
MHAYMDPDPSWGKGQIKEKQRAKQRISGEREFVWGIPFGRQWNQVDQVGREYLLDPHDRAGGGFGSATIHVWSAASSQRIICWSELMTTVDAVSRLH